jgi:hypothetical protein
MKGSQPNAAASDMIAALRASGPRRGADEDPQARAFDNFVGSWQTRYSFIQADGSRLHSTGQLLVAWVLDGRALQDLWIGIPPGQSTRWIGTTLRFYDTARKTWRVTWISPFARAVTMLEGGKEDQRIVLRGDSPQGKLRWSFDDITADRFVWRGELSDDDGATWRLREEHTMLRKA